jgi:hypothetical protein
MFMYINKRLCFVVVGRLDSLYLHGFNDPKRMFTSMMSEV